MAVVAQAAPTAASPVEEKYPQSPQPIVRSMKSVRWPDTVLDDDGVPWPGGCARIRVARATPRAAPMPPVSPSSPSPLLPSLSASLVRVVMALAQPSLPPALGPVASLGLAHSCVDLAQIIPGLAQTSSVVGDVPASPVTVPGHATMGLAHSCVDLAQVIPGLAHSSSAMGDALESPVALDCTAAPIQGRRSLSTWYSTPLPVPSAIPAPSTLASRMGVKRSRVTMAPPDPSLPGFDYVAFLDRVMFPGVVDVVLAYFEPDLTVASLWRDLYIGLAPLPASLVFSFTGVMQMTPISEWPPEEFAEDEDDPSPKTARIRMVRAMKGDVLLPPTRMRVSMRVSKANEYVVRASLFEATFNPDSCANYGACGNLDFFDPATMVQVDMEVEQAG